MNPDYCTQQKVTCNECSLNNYGKDCMNNPIHQGAKYSDLPSLHILKSPAVSVDDEGYLIWMSGKKPRSREEALEQIQEELMENIKEWDHESVESLFDMITDLEQVCTRLEDIIDLSVLPTEPIPDGRETYPIWAMDKSGYCLVGAGQMSIEHISEIRV